MTHTLFVTYLPRGNDSNTKKLVDAFKPKGTSEHLELSDDLPEMFSRERLNAYTAKYYGGQTLPPEKQALLNKMEKLTAQLIKADKVVIAFPMYNFSVPAPVKAWIDSIVVAGKTFNMTPKGPEGLLKGKKALIISTANGNYEGDYLFLDTAAPYVKNVFGFMGIESEIVTANGVGRQNSADLMKTATEKIQAIAKAW